MEQKQDLSNLIQSVRERHLPSNIKFKGSVWNCIKSTYTLPDYRPYAEDKARKNDQYTDEYELTLIRPINVTINGHPLMQYGSRILHLHITRQIQDDQQTDIVQNESFSDDFSILKTKVLAAAAIAGTGALLYKFLK